MKKFTLMLIAAFVAVVSFAQKPVQLSSPYTLKTQPVKVNKKAPARSLPNVARKAAPKAQVTPPANAEEKIYKMTGINYYETNSGSTAEEEWESRVTVIIDGSDVYLKGLVPYYMPDAWAKGTLESNVLTIADQNVGTHATYGIDFYLAGVGSLDDETYTNVVFDYDTTAKTFTARNIIINYNPSYGWLDAYGTIVLTELNADDIPQVVTVPTNLETKELTLEGKSYYSSQWNTVKSQVKVGFDGDDVYIQGLISLLPEAWVKGQKQEGKLLFPSGQYVGTYSGMDVYAIGYDGTNVTDYTFTITDEDLYTLDTYLLENGKPNDLYIFRYYASGLTIGSVPAPKLVVLPEGAEAVDYSMVYLDSNSEEASKPVKVAVVDNDVYFQGMSQYLPEAWVKGTKDGNTVTFPANQYVGEYGSYGSSYFFYNADATFTYDAETESYSATGNVFGVLNDQYYDGRYTNPVLKKVTEKAATPADPAISSVEDSNYGYRILFNVPTVDTEGNGMVTSKLYYQLYIDVEKEVSPLTFTSATHTKLTEDLTVIPYGFTENYDFYDDQIYLNDLYSESWNKVGIKSIYTGGGESHETEIQWYTIKDYTKQTFDFNAMTDEPCSSSTSNEGDITEDRQLTAGNVTLAVSPSTTNTPNRFWSTANGPQLRVYGGTLTFQVPADKHITKLVFNNGKWNAGNSADSGEFTDNTWEGSASKVVVTIAGNTQLNSINVEMEDYTPTPVEAPEGLETATYLFKGQAAEYEEKDAELEFEAYENQVQVGFSGDDVYIQGVAADATDLWVKATKNAEGKYVIPANQYMGTYDVGGYGWFVFDYYFTATDAEGNLTDILLDYDAETNTFSTDQTLVLNGSLTELYPYITYTDVTISKMNEVAATPATPTVADFNATGSYPRVDFLIPTEGTNGETLLTTNLSYQIWIEKDGTEQVLTLTTDLYSKLTEDLTTIPYTFDDAYDIFAGGARVYLNQGLNELKTWTKIGVKSIYTAAGETNESAIGWYDLVEYWKVVTGINGVSSQNDAAVYFDLQGRTATGSQKGLLIKQVRLADGSVKTIKVVRK